MTTITDEFMRQMLSKTKQYCIVILKAGPNRNKDGVEKIIWERGRRNFALREDGVLSIVCAVSDGVTSQALEFLMPRSKKQKRSWTKTQA